MVESEILSVSFREISLKNTKQDRVLLSDIHFTIPKNSVYVIVGKNGTGKTTLIKSLTRLLDERYYNVKGEVLFNNKNLLSLELNELVRIRENKIKYVFQDSINTFNPLKKFEFYFNKFAKDKALIEKYIEYFQLPAKEILFKMHPYEVSGGMNQRISIVLSFLANPQLIILDEPNSSIDPAITNLLIHQLKDFARNGDNSILMVTQDLNFAEKVSDKIAYLKSPAENFGQSEFGTLTPFYSPGEFFKSEQDEISELTTTRKVFLNPNYELIHHA